MRKDASKLWVVVVGGWLLLSCSCAQPPEDVDKRLRTLRARGVDVGPVERELRLQQDKFALFRSYKRTDELLTVLTTDGKLPPRPMAPNQYPGAELCLQDPERGVVCYCYDAGISCVRMVP